MMAFFEKLERAAERIVGNLDANLQEPLTQVLSGDVFTHNTPSVPVNQVVQAADAPQIPVPEVEAVPAPYQPARAIGVPMTLKPVCEPVNA